MIDIETARVTNCALHRVGNKTRAEHLKLSDTELPLDIDGTGELLKHYFLRPFNNMVETHQFTNPVELKLNAVYVLAQEILKGEDLVEYSQAIAKHLFAETRHPNIKDGELFVAEIDGLKFGEETCRAVGIFKSERKDNFFKVTEDNDRLGITVEMGVNIQKLDKGCLILNIDHEDGFKVLTYENAGADTEYWRSEFLSINPLNDNYHQTKNFMALCHDFVKDKLPVEFEITKADQADYLNKSVEYFKTNPEFEASKFLNQVFEEPGIMRSFKNYKDEFSETRQVDLPDEFDISLAAVKKQSKVFKSVIKLDKNFHVYIHGDREMVERGYDEGKKMNYYKLFFNSEA